jgi:general nucleoside transport system ATP-binding protein
MMVGREVSLVVDRGVSHPGDVVLQVEGLDVKDDRGNEMVRGVGFEVRAGEIFGIAGVAGNGQDELIEALVGLRKPTGGTVRLLGKDVTAKSSRDLRARNLAFVPADRQRFGLVLSYPLEDNLVLTTYHEAPFAKRGLRNDRAIDEQAERLIREFDVRTPSAMTKASALSGGNQQKVVVAREFAGDTTLLCLDQPTRGVDVGSIEFIHKQCIAKRDAGAAVLLISAELDEVLELSDRVAVIHRGKLVGTYPAEGAEREHIGLLMARGEAAAHEQTVAAGVDGGAGDGTGEGR